MDPKEEARRFLKLRRSIARQAASLPVHERRAFNRREVADLREMYEPIHRTKVSSLGRELLESMKAWVTRLVKILEAVMDRDVAYALSQHDTDQCNDVQV